MATLTPLAPNSTGTVSGVTDQAGSTTDLYVVVTDGLDSTYLHPGVDSGGSVLLGLSDTDADFLTMDALAGSFRVRMEGTVTDDSMTLTAQVFDGNDTVTPLTDSVSVATEVTAGSSFNAKTPAFTIQGTPTKAQWDNAFLQLVWTYTKNKGSDGISLRVSEAHLTGTYTQANQPPTAAIVSPADAATVGGTVSLEATVSDPDGDDVYAVWELWISTGGASGNVVDTIISPGITDAGLTFDGTNLWLNSGVDIHKFSPQDGSLIDTIPQPAGDGVGLAWDGTNLWQSDSGTDTIYKLNPSDGTVLDSFASPSTSVGDLTWDGTNLWSIDLTTDTIYKHDPSDGTVLDSFASPNTVPRGLTWDGTNLWHIDTNVHIIYEINPTDGTIINSFSVPVGGTIIVGLAWDGTYLWCRDAMNGGSVYKIEILRGSRASEININTTPVTSGTTHTTSWDSTTVDDGDYLLRVWAVDPSGGGQSVSYDEHAITISQSDDATGSLDTSVTVSESVSGYKTSTTSTTENNSVDLSISSESNRDDSTSEQVNAVLVIQTAFDKDNTIGPDVISVSDSAYGYKSANIDISPSVSIVINATGETLTADKTGSVSETTNIAVTATGGKSFSVSADETISVAVEVSGHIPGEQQSVDPSSWALPSALPFSFSAHSTSDGISANITESTNISDTATGYKSANIDVSPSVIVDVSASGPALEQIIDVGSSGLPAVLPFAFGAQSTSIDISENIAESINVTDSIDASKSTESSISANIAVTDNVSGAANHISSIAENTVVSINVVGNANRSATVSEDISVDISAEGAAKRSVSLSEDTTVISNAEGEVDRSVSIDEDIAVDTNIISDISKQVSTSESVTVTSDIQSAASNTAVTEEVISVTSSASGYVGHLSSAHESVAVSSAIEDDITRSSSISESITVAVDTDETIDRAISVSENISAIIAVEGDVSRSTIVSENISVSVSAESSINPAVSIEESISIVSNVDGYKNIADTAIEDVVITASSTGERYTYDSIIVDNVVLVAAQGSKSLTASTDENIIASPSVSSVANRSDDIHDHIEIVLSVESDFDVSETVLEEIFVDVLSDGFKTITDTASLVVDADANALVFTARAGAAEETIAVTSSIQGSLNGQSPADPVNISVDVECAGFKTVAGSVETQVATGNEIEYTSNRSDNTLDEISISTAVSDAVNRTDSVHHILIVDTDTEYDFAKDSSVEENINVVDSIESSKSITDSSFNEIEVASNVTSDSGTGDSIVESIAVEVSCTGVKSTEADITNSIQASVGYSSDIDRYGTADNQVEVEATVIANSVVAGGTVDIVTVSEHLIYSAHRFGTAVETLEIGITSQSGTVVQDDADPVNIEVADIAQGSISLSDSAADSIVVEDSIQFSVGYISSAVDTSAQVNVQVSGIKGALNVSTQEADISAESQGQRNAQADAEETVTSDTFTEYQIHRDSSQLDEIINVFTFVGSGSATHGAAEIQNIDTQVSADGSKNITDSVSELIDADNTAELTKGSNSSVSIDLESFPTAVSTAARYGATQNDVQAAILTERFKTSYAVSDSDIVIDIDAISSEVGRSGHSVEDIITIPDYVYAASRYGSIENAILVSNTAAGPSASGDISYLIVSHRSAGEILRRDSHRSGGEIVPEESHRSGGDILRKKSHHSGGEILNAENGSQISAELL